jgi:hypothetical protein
LPEDCLWRFLFLLRQASKIRPGREDGSEYGKASQLLVQWLLSPAFPDYPIQTPKVPCTAACTWHSQLAVPRPLCLWLVSEMILTQGMFEKETTLILLLIGHQSFHDTLPLQKRKNEFLSLAAFFFILAKTVSPMLAER